LKVPDKLKTYPIHIACELGNAELVELLVKFGGFSILETCNDQGETPLLLCCRLGHDPLINVLLKQGTNVKTRDKNMKTPLWYAAKMGKISLVKTLIDLGSENNVQASDGTTPLLQACKESFQEPAILLVKSGVDVSKYHKHSLGPTPEFRQAVLDAATQK